MKIETQEISSNIINDKKINLFIKRIDKIDDFISGNKWYKLKYNIIEAKRLKIDTILTFGGAYSNHIVATACAAKENGLKSIGIIRGEETHHLNESLKIAKAHKMRLIYISRSNYRKKSDLQFIEDLKYNLGEFYLIPEGGTNKLGVKGAEQILTKKDNYDVICLPVGTGGTISGIINSSGDHQKIIGFPVIKGIGSLKSDIASMSNKENWTLINNYVFGGYAKINNDLIDFINNFYKYYNIPLDCIYTGKMMYGVLDLINNGYFKQNTNILTIHTGGLLANKGINSKFNLNLPII